MSTMLVSFYTHAFFVLSCIIFSLSLISFIKRLQVSEDFWFWEASFSIHRDYHPLLIPAAHSPTEAIRRQKQNFSAFPASSTRFSLPVPQPKKKAFSILDRFTYANPLKPICNYSQNSENYLVIVVLSRASNFDHRQAIRGTWGRNGKFKRNKIRTQTVFFVGTEDGIQSPIRNEQDMFNDVVEIGIPEKYPFVAHKELASILWTRLYCPLAQFVFRADDDILLDIFALLRYLEDRIERPVKPGIYGWFRFNNVVHRADKWSVTKLEYSSRVYPPYTFGIGYLFSNATADALIRAANHSDHRVIRIGDAYITGILRDAAQVPYYDFIGLEYAYTFQQPLECDSLFEKNLKLLICMSKAHVGMMNDPYEFYDAWDVLLARYNLTLLDL